MEQLWNTLWKNDTSTLTLSEFSKKSSTFGIIALLVFILSLTFVSLMNTNLDTINLPTHLSSAFLIVLFTLLFRKHPQEGVEWSYFFIMCTALYSAILVASAQNTLGIPLKTSFYLTMAGITPPFLIYAPCILGIRSPAEWGIKTFAGFTSIVCIALIWVLYNIFAFMAIFAQELSYTQTGFLYFGILTALVFFIISFLQLTLAEWSMKRITISLFCSIIFTTIYITTLLPFLAQR